MSKHTTQELNNGWPQLQVERFVEQFDESYRQLAYYAALPLILTPELLHYLRTRFLPGQVPWIAEADLLLSNLCRQVGYEQYVMDPAVRDYLLVEGRERFGEDWARDAAWLLLQYADHHFATSPFVTRDELRTQHWAAMLYIAERRDQALREIVEGFNRAAPIDLRGAGRPAINNAELARMSRIARILAPQLDKKRYKELLEYAELVGQLVENPRSAHLEQLRRSSTLDRRPRVHLSDGTLNLPAPSELIQALTTAKDEQSLHEAIEDYRGLRHISDHRERAKIDARLQAEAGRLPVDRLRSILDQAPRDRKQETAMAVAVSLGLPYPSDDDVAAAQFLVELLRDAERVRFRAARSIGRRGELAETSQKARDILIAGARARLAKELEVKTAPRTGPYVIPALEEALKVLESPMRRTVSSPGLSSATLYRADVLLVTVTEVERQAVLKLFGRELQRGFTRRFDGNKTYFYLGQVQGAHTYLIHSEMGAGGVGGSMLTVSDSIRALNPGTVIMVGLAFGVDPEKQRIGQILVARQLRAYDLQRVGTGPDRQIGIQLRGDRPRPSAQLVARFENGSAGWKGAKVSFGLVLSGDKLADQQDFREQLNSLEPEAIGVEMEGAGLYAAAQREKVDWIMVKAICDYADGNKAQDKDKRQQTAARNAARFVFHVLNQGGFTGQAVERQPARGASPSATIAGDVGTFQSINISGGTVGSIVGSQTVHGAPQPGASASQEAIDQQQERLKLHRQTLASYLLRLARVGSAYAPPEIDHGIREAREGIRRTKATLRGWGVPVDNHPDDGPEPPGSSIQTPTAQGVPSPQPAEPARTPAGRTRRCADLATSIEETLELIKQYDEQRRLADDPKARLRAERETADLRAQLAAYQREQRELGCDG